jgi:DNA-binding PucR family transcriptional regulator
VATLSGAAGITRYRDVALLVVLLADETRARGLARVELGPLIGDDDVAVRLRETIDAYLTSGESQVATARRLFIHEKTVKYRLRQAEELLGCKISERRSELAAALVVHRVFGADAHRRPERR